jgi:hypothetical protein
MLYLHLSSNQIFRYRPIFLSTLLFSFIAAAATQDKREPIPDLTQTVIENTKKDFLLGPTGMRGWIAVRNTKFSVEDFTNNLSTGFSRQILVTKVEEGSPADGHVNIGDVILGIGDKPFHSDPRHAISAAINQAEKEENGGALSLLLWSSPESTKPKPASENKITTRRITLKLKTLGSYSQTAPYDCPKSKKLYQQTLEAVLRKDKNTNLSIWALSLLATGEEEYINMVKPHLEHLITRTPALTKKSVNKGSTWSWGYQLIFLSEYHLLTGDDSVLPAIKDRALLLSMGQSITGTWGHYMAQPFYSINQGKLHGRLEGYATLNQPSITALMGLALALKCGVDHPDVIQTINKAHRFYAYYINKGGIPYGYDFPKEHLYNNNGTSGSAALTFSFLENNEGAYFYSRLASTDAHKVEIGHTGAFFNTMWSGLGANLGGPELYSRYFKEWTTLRTLTRRWDGAYVFQRAGGGEGNYGRIGPSAAMLLHFALPLRQLYITGKKQDPTLWLKGQDARDTFSLGQAEYSKQTTQKLFAGLGHDLPPVRRRSAEELGSRDIMILAPLRRLLKGSRHQKIGACHTLARLKENAAPVIDDLMELLLDRKEELWVRNRALVALANIGEPARRTIPTLLKMVTGDLPEDDRRHFELYLGTTITTIGEKPLVDHYEKDLIFKTAHKLLTHPHMRGRMQGMKFIEDLKLEDLHLFADQMIHVIRNQDPNYLSYHYDRPTKMGLELLERLNIKDGMDLCLETIYPGIWGQHHRLSGRRGRIAYIQKFGTNAQPYTKRLGELLGASANVAIEAISSSNVTRELISLEEAIELGTQASAK